MRVLVVTVVHHPQDARIYYREIKALLAADIQVSYAAAFNSFSVTDIDARIEQIPIPRATGKRRLAALLAVRKLLKTRSAEFDLVLLHDPELLLVAKASRTQVVWDVHEDTAAAISAKAWIPRLIKLPLKVLIKKLEQRAEAKYCLLLAETEYQKRFQKHHPVIPNTTFISAPASVPVTKSVIYLGSVTSLRGGYELIEIAQLLKPHAIKVEVVGSCPGPELSKALHQEAAAGNLIWHGFLPNEAALKLLPGKLAGLSLLHNHPNYQVSQPTKIYEYMAAQLPVISTPLPHAANLIETAAAGFIVEFKNAAAAAEKIVELASNPALQQELGRNGFDYVRSNHNWEQDQKTFISALANFSVK
jgi:glycosyltransferase involved in cell wall biosynthesis